jgi:hypothetical protein
MNVTMWEHCTLVVQPVAITLLTERSRFIIIFMMPEFFIRKRGEIVHLHSSHCHFSLAFMLIAGTCTFKADKSDTLPITLHK